MFPFLEKQKVVYYKTISTSFCCLKPILNLFYFAGVRFFHTETISFAL